MMGKEKGTPATPQTPKRTTRSSSATPSKHTLRTPRTSDSVPPSTSSDLLFSEKSISLDNLLSSFPGRRLQILELLRLIGPLNSPMIPFLIYGGVSTGKTSVILQIFKHLNRPFVYSSCRSCYNPRILFESVLNKLLAHQRNASNGYSSAKRCEKVADFVNLLKEALIQVIDGINGCSKKTGLKETMKQGSGRMVYLIFDNVELLRAWDKNSSMISTLFNISDILKMPEVGLIFISGTSPDTYYSNTGFPDPLPVFFPDYTDDDLYQIFMRNGRERAAKMGESKTVHSPLLTYFSMLSLLTLCPPFVILLWYTMVHADGSVALTCEYLKQTGLVGFKSIWPKPSATAWKIIAYFAVFEAILQLVLPGERVEGPISPTGNRPIYKANGLAAYAVTLITYLSLWWFGIFNPAIVYDHLGEIFSALIMGSFVFCILLYIKGHLLPSSSDSGSSGNILIDFYWGMELYPRIGKSFDIKVFTNCRFGMMSWAVLAVTYCIKQYEMNGHVADSILVNTALMLVYVTKFFLWEAGYWNTMDIAHDRAGFYICWGCLVWVPSIYTSPGMYLVNHPVNLGAQLALFILVAGIVCIYVNYDCDRQRQEFRKTNGKCSIWGKAPSKITASYTTANGETKSSILLTSGWWGLSRHFHYVPEILAAFFWTVPALFNHFLPYFYVIFLTILLFDRAKRDDDRCLSKYQKYWKLYCQKVPYRIIPGIY